MTHSRAARRYAAALMAALDIDKAAERVAQDLQMVAATLRHSRELRMLVASPIVRGDKKASVFKALFASRVGPHTMGFLDLLIAKQREGILEETIEQYMKLRDIQQGIVNIDVVSAVELTQKQVDALKEQMERVSGKKARLRLGLNPGIKGGIIVRVGDTVLDASVRHQLEILAERFARAEFARAVSS
jgi:F-type H+-transporting ATPase subunit delta